MPKVTFQLTPVVSVIIKGEGKNSRRIARDDGGLVLRFLRFQLDEKIFEVIRGGSSGAGVYYGLFTAEDAKKIEAWLLKQGAKHKRGVWR